MQLCGSVSQWVSQRKTCQLIQPIGGVRANMPLVAAITATIAQSGRGVTRGYVKEVYLLGR